MTDNPQWRDHEANLLVKASKPHTVSASKFSGTSIALNHPFRQLTVPSLTRPSLTSQYPLPSTSIQPHETTLPISSKASLAYPDLQPNVSPFILTPILQLPESFQAAYVGEVFAATLCANNEHGDARKRVRNVKIAAEILGPGAGEAGVGVPLELEGDKGGDVEGWLGEGETLQRVLRLSLREEGPHTLGVTVSYVEADNQGGRNVIRTFRKLYQFVAMPLLGVRTKAGDVVKGKDGRVKYAVEAQLENVGERVVVLEVSFPFTTTFYFLSVTTMDHRNGS
jgi:trafficking protein particle complex subunit 13